jgi:hypothetical protein
MRLGGIKHQGKPSHLSPAEHSARPASDSRALVPLAAAAHGHRAHGHDAHDAHVRFREAGFLAQLIACKDQHPQMRERRRATAEEAVAAYRAVARFSRQAQ